MEFLPLIHLFSDAGHFLLNLDAPIFLPTHHVPPRQEIYVPGLSDGFQMSGQHLILGSRTF